MFVYMISYDIKKKIIKKEKFEIEEDGESVLIKLNDSGGHGKIRSYKENFEKINIDSNMIYMWSFDDDIDKFINIAEKKIIGNLDSIHRKIHKLKSKESEMVDFLYDLYTIDRDSGNKQED